jgi:hypothetical protein
MTSVIYKFAKTICFRQHGFELDIRRFQTGSFAFDWSDNEVYST